MRCLRIFYALATKVIELDQETGRRTGFCGNRWIENFGKSRIEKKAFEMFICSNICLKAKSNCVRVRSRGAEARRSYSR